MPMHVGADIGGTFTDLVLVSDDGTTFEFGKILTTPRQPDDAIIEGLDKLLVDADIARDGIVDVLHGTTLFTNALIERKGSVTALITTRGFRDAIEIGREHRYDIYDLRMKRPKPLAPRRLRFELNERVLADGTIRTPLDVAEVRSLAQTLKDSGVEAVGVSLIHGYANDIHERQVGEILKAEVPEIAVTLSSELVPEIGEYVRGSTVLANVYVKRIAEQYLGRLNDRLRGELDLPATLFIMQSDGGLCEIEEGAQAPVRLIESGPAGGALAAAYYGEILGHKDVLAFDMGGTTAKACVIANGVPLVANEFEVDRQYQFKKQSGLPIKVPVIEMIEIGTGGGSIARVDAMRRLQVGPDSAGSEPGPAAYALGGEAPTVTDADLLLGYLDPDFFLGGTMELDMAAAEQAVREQVAEPLGLSVLEAAWGIHQLANESMASAARIHTIERGMNITRFPIFATGGAGPVHAFGVASILRSPQVIYPLGAGVMSAIGFLTAPLSMSFARSLPGKLDDMDWSGVTQAVTEMEEQGLEILGRTIDAGTVSFRRFVDMRYVKQGFEVRVPLANDPLNEAYRNSLQSAFEDAYRAIYGHALPDVPIEVVSWRIVAEGPKPKLTLPKSTGGNAADVSGALKRHRAIYIPAERALVECPVYDRYLLPAGAKLAGPAVIEERESTVVVNGSGQIQVDENCNLIIDLAGAGS